VSRSPVPPLMKASSRDHGLHRVRNATGWISALAAAGGLVLAGGYALALPGKSYSTVASTNTASGQSASGQSASGQSAFGQPAPTLTTPAAAANHPTAAAGRRHASGRRPHRAHALRPPAQAPVPTQAPPMTVSGAS
jgi:hypothetical protein